MLALKTILHPTDFSERSKAAFYLASWLAREHHARLVALYVVPPQAVAYGEIITEVSNENAKEAARSALAALQPQVPGVTLERRIETGDAALGILKVADEIQADLIVLGTHGRTGLGRILLGSVAEEVLRKATCPVLTIKTPLAHPAVTPEAQQPATAGV